MECLKCNKKNKKIYEKINYTKLLIVVIVCIIFFTISFYYIGEKRDINNSLRVASIISILLGASSIIGDIIDNRDRMFIIDNDNIGYIEIHKEKVSGPYLKDEEYFKIINKKGIEEVFKNNHLYEGIDKGTITSIISIKKKYNRMVVKANVIEKMWKSSSSYTISKLYVVEKERKKKIIIPNDLDNYEELYKKITIKNKM